MIPLPTLLVCLEMISEDIDTFKGFSTFRTLEGFDVGVGDKVPLEGYGIIKAFPTQSAQMPFVPCVQLHVVPQRHLVLKRLSALITFMISLL